MYTAEALALRGMRDTVVVQIAIRIEKGSAGVLGVRVHAAVARRRAAPSRRTRNTLLGGHTHRVLE
jgi:hypothetical protein